MSTMTTPEPQRPPFMVTLGLLPPYTREDIQEAYHEKAKTTHPDRGGSASDFEKLPDHSWMLDRFEDGLFTSPPLKPPVTVCVTSTAAPPTNALHMSAEHP